MKGMRNVFLLVSILIIFFFAASILSILETNAMFAEIDIMNTETARVTTQTAVTLEAIPTPDLNLGDKIDSVVVPNREVTQLATSLDVDERDILGLYAGCFYKGDPTAYTFAGSLFVPAPGIVIIGLELPGEIELASDFSPVNVLRFDPEQIIFIVRDFEFQAVLTCYGSKFSSLEEEFDSLRRVEISGA